MPQGSGSQRVSRGIFCVTTDYSDTFPCPGGVTVANQDCIGAKEVKGLRKGVRRVRIEMQRWDGSGARRLVRPAW